MARAFGLLVAVLGWAIGASAGSLTVYTTDLAGNPRNVFEYFETFRIVVTGDGLGDTSETSLVGELHWNGAITDPVSATQGIWLTDLGVQFLSDGSALAFNQTGPVTNAFVATSVITLKATDTGISTLTWGGISFDFFGTYAYDSGGISGPITQTGSSFCIQNSFNPPPEGPPRFSCAGFVPEPATGALVALGLLGPALVGRARRRQKSTSRSSD